MSSSALVSSRKVQFLTEEEFLELDPQDQKYYCELLERELQYRSSRRVLFYEPHEKQLKFHLSECKIRAIFGGNRSGKTFSGGMEFVMHMTKTYPDWYPDKIKMDPDKKVKGRIVVKDFGKGAGEVVIPFLEQWIDPALIEKKVRNPAGTPVKWILKDGSSFDLLSHEQDTEQYEGWHGDFAWFDEPPPRDKYIATLRGLVDTDGRAWLTLTPLTQPWIYDDIFTKADKKRIFVIVVDITDNPHLSREAIKDFEASLNEEEKEARLRGKFMHLSGLIYKEFDQSVHICEPFQIPKDWTKYFCVDPHPRKPSACLWLAVDPHDNHFIYDELWVPDLSLEELSQAVLVQEGDKTPRMRFIDPHADNTNVLAGGFNVRKELMKHGLFCQPANSDPVLGKSRIRHALRPRYSKTLQMNIPQLKVFRTCQRTIYEFQHYVWDDYKRNKEDYDLKEAPKKKFDDMMDNLRYIYNFGPRFFTPEDDAEDNVEVVYEGQYARQSKTVEKKSNYYDLVDDRAGKF